MEPSRIAVLTLPCPETGLSMNWCEELLSLSEILFPISAIGIEVDFLLPWPKIFPWQLLLGGLPYFGNQCQNTQRVMQGLQTKLYSV